MNACNHLEAKVTSSFDTLKLLTAGTINISHVFCSNKAGAKKIRIGLFLDIHASPETQPEKTSRLFFGMAPL